MRIPRVQTEIRESFAAEMFRTRAGLSIRGCQVLLRARFGHEMRPARLLDIRSLVRTGRYGLTPVVEPAKMTGTETTT